MRTIKYLLLQFCCSLLVVFPGITFAQGVPLGQLQTDLVSAWLLTIEGEERPRTLRITATAPNSENKLLLEATYG